MYPTLFRIGDVAISSYSVMVLIAYLVAYKLIIAECKRKELGDNLGDLFFGATVIGGLGGAKVLFLLQNVTFFQLVSDPVRYLSSGLTFLGGFLGAIALIGIIVRWNRLNFWLVTDALSPALVIAYGIGRIGCLLVGDDYGTPTEVPWAIAFPNGDPPTTEEVHPTQIYDTLLMTATFLFLWSVRKKDLSPGWLTGITFIILGAERFFIEFVRNTTPSFIPGISQAQLISLVIFVVGLLEFIRAKAHADKVVSPKA